MQTWDREIARRTTGRNIKFLHAAQQTELGLVSAVSQASFFFSSVFDSQTLLVIAVRVQI